MAAKLRALSSLIADSSTLIIGVRLYIRAIAYSCFICCRARDDTVVRAIFR